MSPLINRPDLVGNPAYFDVACRRLRGDEAKPRKEQPSLFDTLGATP